MPLLELSTEAGENHAQLILVQCPPHLEVTPTPDAWSRFPEGRSSVIICKGGKGCWRDESNGFLPQQPSWLFCWPTG